MLFKFDPVFLSEHDVEAFAQEFNLCPDTVYEPVDIKFEEGLGFHFADEIRNTVTGEVHSLLTGSPFATTYWAFVTWSQDNDGVFLSSHQMVPV